MRFQFKNKKGLILRSVIIIFCISILLLNSSYSQNEQTNIKTVIYKEIDTLSLFLEIHYPQKIDESKVHPIIVFFFGGGWINGDRTHFLHQAEYFAKRGIIAALADYRTYSKNNTTPFESVMDAKSCVRFIKQHGKEYGIDKNKIIVSGGSAGGHLAAATALIDDFNDTKDDLSISCKPNALVLFNPAIDNGPAGAGYERIRGMYKSFSPLHNIKVGAPPTIIFLGTKDKVIPVETMEYFQMCLEKVGSRCELNLYEGKEHGFFNYGKEDYMNTLLKADEFLVSLEYLKKRIQN